MAKRKIYERKQIARNRCRRCRRGQQVYRVKDGWRIGTEKVVRSGEKTERKTNDGTVSVSARDPQGFNRLVRAARGVVKSAIHYSGETGYDLFKYHTAISNISFNDLVDALKNC